VIIEVARRFNTEVHLWYPVLADRLDGQDPDEGSRVRSVGGYLGYGHHGLWEGFEESGESFLFHCPQDSEVIEHSITEVRSLLDIHGFSGVFLDRIRYPSPANGIEMLLSCFCDRCGAVNHSSTQDALRFWGELCQSGEFLSWDDLIIKSGLEELFDSRTKHITDLVTSIGDGIDRSKYLIGLDLFSPALASLVGQDYCRLAEICDWIKAMTYTKAVGPAGLPLEVSSLISALQTLNPQVTADQASRWVEALLGFDENSIPSFGRKVLQQEIQRAKTAVANHSELVVGVELVDHPQFPTTVSPQEAKELIDGVRDSKQSLIACWNLLYIPEETQRILALNV